MKSSLPPLQRLHRSWLLLSVAAFVVACSGAPAPVDVPRGLAEGVRQYLLEPDLSGMASDAAQELQLAYRDLVDRSQADGVAQRAQAWMSSGRGADAARTLYGQALFADGDATRAIEVLEPALETTTDDAVGLVLGRAAEQAGDTLLAYAAYRASAARLASRRAGDLEPEALDLARDQFSAGLQQGRVDLAEQWLDTLRLWSPESPQALASELDLARAEQDAVGELAALRSLRARIDLEQSELVRMAWLELDVGDPQAGVDLFTLLSERAPDDASIADGLAAAKFRWRLDMLPEEASTLVEPRPVTRAELATLIYWLVPGVRADRGATGEIVSDVLDHPLRAPIVRVVNLGIMGLDDAARHRFGPDREVPRRAAFQSLLRIPDVLGVAPSCLREAGANPDPSPEAICRAAEGCGLLAAAEPCLPGSSITGTQASEALRRTLLILEPR